MSQDVPILETHRCSALSQIVSGPKAPLKPPGLAADDSFSAGTRCPRSTAQAISLSKAPSDSSGRITGVFPTRELGATIRSSSWLGFAFLSSSGHFAFSVSPWSRGKDGENTCFRPVAAPSDTYICEKPHFKASVLLVSFDPQRPSALCAVVQEPERFPCIGTNPPESVSEAELGGSSLQFPGAHSSVSQLAFCINTPVSHRWFLVPFRSCDIEQWKPLLPGQERGKSARLLLWRHKPKFQLSLVLLAPIPIRPETLLIAVYPADPILRTASPGGMEKSGPELLLSGAPFSPEAVKSKDICKYTPRSAGSVQRPQRSENLLELVRFFTDYNAPFPEDDVMGFGDGGVPDIWVPKELRKAKKWKSQEDLRRQKGWQKWRKNKPYTSTSGPDEKPPPPICKDPRVPELVLPASGSKSMIGDVACECFYAGVGTLPPTANLSDEMLQYPGNLTSMWTPPTPEMPLTPSSAEFSPAAESRDRKHAGCGNATYRREVESRSSAESKPDRHDDGGMLPQLHPSVYACMEAPEHPQPQPWQPGHILTASKGSVAANKGRETPSSKRDGVCVADSEQTQIALPDILSIAQQQSPYIDAQYLPQRTSSRRRRPQEQPDPHCLAQDYLHSGFQNSLSVSEPEASLLCMPTRKHPVRRPAPLILSPDYQLGGFVTTLPPTPATPSCNMGQAQGKESPHSLSAPTKALPPTPTEPSSRNKSVGGKKPQKPASKVSSLWPPRLNLRPSRDIATKTEAMSPWRGNAFAQLSSLPSSPTVPLDPSTQLQEAERRASEVQQHTFSSRTNNMAATMGGLANSGAGDRRERDMGSKDDIEISPKSSLTRQRENTEPVRPLTSPNLRKDPGEPPNIPLPANPPKCTSRPDTPNKGHTMRSEQPQTVPNTPSADGRSFEQVLRPKTPNSARAKRSAAASPRNSQSSHYSRHADGHIPQSSCDTVDLTLTSRPVTPSLPSSDDEKGVYAYCGSASRSSKSRRRHRHDNQSIDAFALSSPIQRRKDRDASESQSPFAASRPSTRESLERRRFGSPSRLSGSSGADSLLIQQLQEKVAGLERQNKMLRAALAAALDMGGRNNGDSTQAGKSAKADAILGPMLSTAGGVSQGVEAAFDIDNVECH
ncbi:predicted protein [Uncinocarpus reesii 1704]|uniref:Uncharacterized protein n=1 Tax=Uncinocarpus reesii (strain UAMH 1704) TaxID=336963 RepID=C4JPD5_UNCRE|nr:uncharacterized protein UREG_04517 [Uncinocarpus reesii 1704]EEP79671.1 predicted protein [Uncinocarpus reesii 1704]